MSGCPTNLNNSKARPTVLAVGAGFSDIFISSFIPPL